MKQIDFLPQRYHDQHVRQRAGLWRLLVCLLFGSAIVGASAVQFAYRAKVQARLDAVQPLLAETQAKSDQLAQMQTELTKITHRANVCALLQVPLPRTHIVLAIVTPVPDAVEIEELHIARRAVARVDTRPQSEAAGGNANEELPPAARDAKALEQSLRNDQTVVTISGLTDDAAGLHAYLETLEGSPLVARAELLAIESVASGPAQGRGKFTAEVHIAAPFDKGTVRRGSPAELARRID